MTRLRPKNIDDQTFEKLMEQTIDKHRNLAKELAKDYCQVCEKSEILDLLIPDLNRIKFEIHEIKVLLQRIDIRMQGMGGRPNPT